MSEPGLLPFVDAWSVDVAAPPRVVWEAVLAFTPGPYPSLAYRAWARIWRADPADSNGRPAHALGAERPGFVVAEVVPPVTYALAGAHRFARYQLVFRIEQRGHAHSRLTAETFASFPGAAGRLYRVFLLDARMHAAVMWLAVRRIRRRAEALAEQEESNVS